MGYEVMSEAFRIALLDDHAIVRLGYRRLLELEPGLVVVAEYGDATAAEQGLRALTDDQLDLLVLDLSLPGRSGVEFLQVLHGWRPQLKVLVVSMHESPIIQQQCMLAGASGVVAKSNDPERLVDAVRRLQFGMEVQGMARIHRDLPLHHALTAREFEVMQYLLSGRGIAAIADSMGVNAKTVYNYQALLRQKLEITGTMGLVHYAQAHGLMPGACVSSSAAPTSAGSG